jgi:hypothetical protein
MTELPRTLFVGRKKGAVAWYRCALPAEYLEQDWIAIDGEDTAPVQTAGKLHLEVPVSRYADYQVLILQQPRGTVWLRRIRELQAAGVQVLFEVDDYVHAVRKSRDHDFKDQFDRDVLRDTELVMRACDGIICSTEWLARRYRAFNERVYVCRNGLDLGRYRVTRPARETVNVGWSGATGHTRAMKPWLQVVDEVMRERHGKDRAFAIPFTSLDTYPAAMTLFDIALAPAGNSNFFRGKSDLRFLEAGAIGLPVIGDPLVYPSIEHGVTGLHATSPAEVREHLLALVDDRDRAERIGAAAREYVERERDMKVMSRQWAAVIRDVAGVPVEGEPAPRVHVPI